ncbi:MAG TPA: adenosine deaminase [Sediminibacterium sp.]|jgi:adenosine deaminase|uniref:adenosine deaminase n=1 Tax=Sediminibacterium sp. TaxID=1917865 RepID=UPI0026BD379F|nr:adenosine deaminase [Sediminibacterium sp.]HQS22989.1 adenosine deaminase [Sediminibacterium sp.]HQS33785.1 adenosine deaminase [Sediminibacterium sp.]
MNAKRLLILIFMGTLNYAIAQNAYTRLPKVELHLHLDCSLSFECVKQLKPKITQEEYNESFIAPPKCTDLADYITRAIKGFELMQTKDQLRIVTLDLFKQLKRDNIVYAEIRFAPLQHTMEGLTPTEVVETVNAATEEGVKEYGVEAGIILCTLRHYSEAQSMETAELVKKFKGTLVVGFDIAADEAGFPINNHIKAFDFANQNNIKCTAHAGEARGAESVWETLKHFKPLRIGHGVRSVEDINLLNYLKKNDIHLEVCPTSNVQTNVVDKIENHPINQIYNHGVSMSVNTDAKTISNVTLSSEYHLLNQVFKWDLVNFKKCNLEAIKHSFASDEVKRKISKLIQASY